MSTRCVIVLLTLLTAASVTAEPAASRKSSSSRSSTSSSGSSGSRKMNCTTALAKCTRRMPCGMALHDYRISCKQELYGVSKNCSELCQLAIISLAQIPEGSDYLTCPCDNNNDYCRLIRNRTYSCQPAKKASKEGDIDTCRGAELYCKADSVCNTSYDYYKRSCADLIKGKSKGECNRRCNNTVGLLWRQKAGGQLKNCTCEKGNYKCVKERQAVMRGCLGLANFRAGYTSTSTSHLTAPFAIISSCTLISILLLPLTISTLLSVSLLPRHSSLVWLQFRLT